MSSWIKLHRSLRDWQWYDDHNATRLLLHLLISVNYKDKEWKGQTIKAGSYVTSWENLAKEIGLSVKQTRVAMSKLENAKEVTRKATNKWQAISLVKWDKLQYDDTKEGQTNGQTKDKQRATTKESKEIKNNTIPSFDEFLAYAVELKPNINTDDVRLKYNSWLENDWSVNRNGKLQPILRWKVTLSNTIPYIRENKITTHTEIWEGC